MQTFEKDLFYDVVNNGFNNIELKVLINDIQTSYSSVLLEDKLIAQEKDSFQIDLGQERTLVRKTMHIMTTIHDIDPNDDQITLEIEINGGKEVLNETICDFKVQPSGSATFCRTRIIFY